MAVTSPELVWHNSQFLTGGDPSGADFHDLESTFTAGASTGDYFLEDTALGGSDGDHDGKWIVVVDGNSELFVAKVLRSVAGSGYEIDAPLESSTSIGDTYRIFQFLVGNNFAIADEQDCAEGRSRHRAWYCRNDGANGIDEIYVWIKEVRNPGHFDVAIFGDDANGGTLFIPVIADQFAGPTQSQLDTMDPGNEFSSPKSAVSGQYSHPRRTHTQGDVSITSGNSYGLYVRRDTAVNTPPSEGLFLLVFEARDQDTTNLIRAAVPFVISANGYTPDLDLSFDRILRIGGGARVNAVLRAEETGALVEDTEVGFEVSSGPGVVVPREEGSVTDDEGETFASYLAPSQVEPIVDSFMTEGLLPAGYTLTRLSLGYDGSYVDSAGDVQDAAANSPRWTHDHLTLALRGLLNEPERENLQFNSAQPQDNAGGWADTAATITTATGSLRGETASRAQSTPGSPGAEVGGFRSVLGLSGDTSGLTYVGSIWVKDNGGVDDGVRGNLTVLPSGQEQDAPTLLTANDQRVEVALTISGSSELFIIPRYLEADESGSFDLIHGQAQFEFVPSGEEAEASSWIRTAGSTLVRARDTLVRTGIPNGVYDVTISRDGIADQVLSGVLITGSYEVPTSVHPLQSITFSPASAGEQVTVEARI